MTDKAQEKIVTPFKLDDGVTTIEAVLDRRLGAKRSAAFDSLRVSRGLQNAEVVLTTPMVNYLVMEQGASVQFALDAVRQAMPGYLETANRDALIVTIFDNLFRLEFRDGLPVVAFALPEYTIEESDFDDSEDNNARWQTAAEAPIPPRKPTNVIEQKLMYLQKLLEANKRFALNFTKTFENWFAEQGQMEVDARRVDANGFRSGNVGVDSHVTANADSETG